MKSGEPKKFDGIAEGHPIEAFFHNVELQVQDFPDKVSIRAGFTDSDCVAGLLGQEGFFKNFRVTFKGWRGCFWVEDKDHTVRGR